MCHYGRELWRRESAVSQFSSIGFLSHFRNILSLFPAIFARDTSPDFLIEKNEIYHLVRVVEVIGRV